MDSDCENICGSYEWSPKDPTEELDQMTGHTVLQLPLQCLLIKFMSNDVGRNEKCTWTQQYELIPIKAIWKLKNKVIKNENS